MLLLLFPKFVSKNLVQASKVSVAVGGRELVCTVQKKESQCQHRRRCRHNPPPVVQYSFLDPFSEAEWRSVTLSLGSSGPDPSSCRDPRVSVPYDRSRATSSRSQRVNAKCWHPAGQQTPGSFARVEPTSAKGLR